MSSLSKYQSIVSVSTDALPNSIKDIELKDVMPICCCEDTYKIYVEDNFPWYDLKQTFLVEAKYWFMVSHEGFRKSSKTTLLDEWIIGKTEMKSKTYYTQVNYSSKQGCWKFKFNHYLADIDEFLNELRKIIGPNINASYEDVTYSANVEEMDLSSLIYGITTIPEARKWVSVIEKKFVASESKSISLSIHHEEMTMIIKIEKNTPTRFMIKNVKRATEDEIKMICFRMCELAEVGFQDYVKDMAKYGIYVSKTKSNTRLPKGFSRYASINNVIMPEIIPKHKVEKVKSEGKSVLEYDGQYWTCPIGYIPCITENRKMNNNDTVKMIVKCNSRGKPNIQRTTTESNYTFVNPSRVIQDGDVGMVGPKTKSLLGVVGTMNRFGVNQDKNSFLRCVFKALNITTDPDEFRRNHKFNPWIVKQENRYKDVDEILEEFADTEKTFCSSRYHRAIEEAFDVNIVLIDMTKTGVDYHIPDTDTMYLWNPVESRKTIVVVRNASVETGAYKRICHELIRFDGKNYYIKDPICIRNKNIRIKSQRYAFSNGARLRMLVLPNKEWTGQQINEDGKCVALERNGRWFSCFDAPKNLPAKSIIENNLPTFSDINWGKDRLRLDTKGDHTIGVWVGKRGLYIPIRPSIVKGYDIGMRCVQIKRSMFGEEGNISKRKYVTIVGGDNMKSWWNYMYNNHNKSQEL